MTKEQLNKKYFDWMYGLVCDERHFKKRSYRKLLSQLHNTEFIYILDMDGNRAEDGVNLRYRFGYEFDYPDPMIATFLDDKPCSVLEMMVALVVRCEEDIMDNPDIGDRTGKWFWTMIENLGLLLEHDDNYNCEYVRDVIDIFMDRRYEPNGEGGLFTIEDCKRDLRFVEIWYQMMWYLDTVQ